MDEPAANELAVHKAGPLTRLTIARPRLGNSLSGGLVLALSEAVAACVEDGTRIMAIEGGGANFCTGFDLSLLDAESDDTLLARFVRIELLLQQIHRAPFLTVALARGKALGAGADLFAACEQRWVVDAAQFAFPGAAFGLVLGTQRLASRVGVDVARDWIRRGRVVSSEEAFAAGLASRVLDAAEAETALEALVPGIDRLDPLTWRAVHAASLVNDPEHGADALRALVESAARPGLKARIEAYRRAVPGRSSARQDALRSGQAERGGE